MQATFNLQILCFFQALIFTSCYFNPFADSELFMINWVGTQDHLPGKIDLQERESVIVTTKKNEKYQCILPDSVKTKEDEQKTYTGPTADELMDKLFSQTACSYRIESYWTYELCHGKHLRQYHDVKEQTKKPKIQEYYLGKGRHILESPDAGNAEETSSSTKMKYRKIESLELPYYEVLMTQGTMCELTNAPRQARVMYICQVDGHGEIYELKETSTCEYDVMVLTAVLCSHPDYRPKTAPVNQIQCLSLDNSPLKPAQMNLLEMEEKSNSGDNDVFSSFINQQADHSEASIELSVQESKLHRPKVYRKEQDLSIGSATDKNLLRDVLSGEHCLRGGGGWWQYEFCYGKYARQFHDDVEGRTIVNLGFWNEAQHKEWIDRNPSKRMLPAGERKMLHMYYSGGDVCDLTGAKRFVEVRLKCVTNVKHPHSVALYLMEPAACEYVLGIESPIFCSLLNQADDYGLLKNIDLGA